ncbi:MAG: flagellar biosynthesis protein FliS [Rhodobacteraceae bacterium]|nr:flagellar biosynthesis protein FliS [Paracoccaceae bacterium]
MEFDKVAKAYRKTDMFGAAEAKDPETVVIMVMEELIKAVSSFHKNISLKSGDLITRSKTFSRSISVIYMLQSSLDLEKGGQLASDLFRIYEYLRIHLIKDLRTGSVNKSSIALNSIVDIKEAWLSLASD